MSVNATTHGLTSTASLQKQLERFVADNSDIRGGVVSTVDGFEVAASLAGALSAAKLSAMTSSLLALSEAISRESALGTSRDMVIDAELGRLLLMEVPASDSKLLLTVLCDNVATLGQVLWAVKAFRDELGQISID